MRGGAGFDSARWTPEFRRWIDAYHFDGVEDDRVLDELDASASEAGARARRGRAVGVCRWAAYRRRRRVRRPAD